MNSQLGSEKATEHTDTINKTNDLKAPVIKEEALTPTKSFKLRHNQVQTISNGHALKPAPPSIENGALLQAEPAEYKKVRYFCNFNVLDFIDLSQWTSSRLKIYNYSAFTLTWIIGPARSRMDL